MATKNQNQTTVQTESNSIVTPELVGVYGETGLDDPEVMAQAAAIAAGLPTDESVDAISDEEMESELTDVEPEITVPVEDAEDKRRREADAILLALAESELEAEAMPTVKVVQTGVPELDAMLADTARIRATQIDQHPGLIASRKRLADFEAAEVAYYHDNPAKMESLRAEQQARRDSLATLKKVLLEKKIQQEKERAEQEQAASAEAARLKAEAEAEAARLKALRDAEELDFNNRLALAQSWVDRMLAAKSAVMLTKPAWMVERDNALQAKFNTTAPTQSTRTRKPKSDDKSSDSGGSSRGGWASKWTFTYTPAQEQALKDYNGHDAVINLHDVDAEGKPAATIISRSRDRHGSYQANLVLKAILGNTWTEKDNQVGKYNFLWEDATGQEKFGLKSK